MFRLLQKSVRGKTPSGRRHVRPDLESLEGRLLLYSTLGGHWVYGSRITYSLVPDGTSIGGTPSVLFQTLNSRFSQSTWQLQFQKAAAVWQAVANINLVQVNDSGTAIGASGNQQGDPRFGDIRVMATPLGGGTLGQALLPPPFNGGTAAGDIILNSSIPLQINSNYDLETVAIHEFGHALGMGHSQIASAEMYAYYNGMKQTLASDDVAGMQAIYGARQNDIFGTGSTPNFTFLSAENINSYIDANGQIAIPSLDITTQTQSDWYYVTAPTSTTGTMTVTVQSSNLSELTPRMLVYNASLQVVGTANSTKYGDTISATINGVRAGQSFYVRAFGNPMVEGVGGYGLLLNFGSQAQLPIAPPNTVVYQQPDQGGGGTNITIDTAGTLTQVSFGHFKAWADILTFSNIASALPPSVLAPFVPRVSTLVQDLIGWVTNLTGGSGTTDTTASSSTIDTATPSTACPQMSGLALTILQAVDAVLADWKAGESSSGSSAL